MDDCCGNFLFRKTASSITEDYKCGRCKQRKCTSYDLQTSVSDSTDGYVENIDSYVENDNVYELLFMGSNSVYTKFCVYFDPSGNEEHLYVTEGTADENLLTIKCKLYEDTSATNVKLSVDSAGASVTGTLNVSSIPDSQNSDIFLVID